MKLSYRPVNQESGGEANGYHFTIKIHKENENGDSLSGAVFEVIRDSSGVKVGEITTDSNGNGSLGGLLKDKYTIKEKKAPAGSEIDDKTYTLDMMIQFIKKRLDEITKINLYDIGLSEEELERRKQKKYELKKALKGCTYGDVNDKKYVKELIFDLLFKEYGVNEVNISKAIPFDIPSLLTAQDKFDILINEYKKSFGYEALNELIKKYNLAELKYVDGSSKPSYVITEDDIHNIYEAENLNVSFEDKMNVVVQRIYQKYKGYSSIDEVRDMNIDRCITVVYLGFQKVS